MSKGSQQMKFWKLTSAATVLILSTSANAALINVGYDDFNNPSLNSINPNDGASDFLANITNWVLLYEDNDGTGTLSINASSDFIGNMEINNAILTTNSNGSLHVDGTIDFLGFGGFSANFIGDIAITYDYDEMNDVTVFGFSPIELVGLDYSGLLMLDGPFLGHLLDFNVTASALAYVENPFPVYSPVPLPAAVWLFGSGLIGLIGLARRKKA